MKSFYTFGKFWAVLLLSLILGGTAAGTGMPLTATSITTQTTAFLQKFVDKEGKVNYEALQRNSEMLDALLSNIAGFDVSKAEMADQYAFCLNACNILVIGEIARKYPLASVQDMPGFFNRAQMRVGREVLTLEQIETDKLRKIHDDPRLHFALVCGTSSCPRLSRAA